jgi:hypothetical protein
MFNFIHQSHNEALSDQPAPQDSVSLNGTMLARLINMRIERANHCSCERCEDLLSNIHNNCSSLAREHNNELWGLKFWSGSATQDGKPPTFGYVTEDAAQRLRRGATEHHDGFVDSLMAAEREWQRAQTSVCSHEDSDDYWIKQYDQVKRHNEELRRKLDQEEQELPLIEETAGV